MEKVAILKTVFVASMVLAVLVGASSAQVGNPGFTMDVTPIEDEICPGDIVCKTCDIVFWCRALDKKNDKK